MNAIIGHKQSIWDFAIQHCGAAEMAFDVALANGLSVTDDVAAGTELIVPSVQNKPVVDYLAKQKVSPATEISSFVLDYGIGLMSIGNTFIIR